MFSDMCCLFRGAGLFDWDPGKDVRAEWHGKEYYFGDGYWHFIRHVK